MANGEAPEVPLDVDEEDRLTTLDDEPTIGQRLGLGPGGAPAPGTKPPKLPNPLLFLIPGFWQGFASVYSQRVTRERLDAAERRLGIHRSFTTLRDIVEKVPKSIRGPWIDHWAKTHTAAYGVPVEQVFIDTLKKAGDEEAATLGQLLGDAAANLDMETLLSLTKDANKAFNLTVKSLEFKRAEAARRQFVTGAEPDDETPDDREAANVLEAGRQQFFRSPAAAQGGDVRGVPIESPTGPHPLALPAPEDPLDALIRNRDTTEQLMADVPERSRPAFQSKINRLNSQIFGLAFTRRLRELRKQTPGANIRDLQQQAALETTAEYGIDAPERFQLFLAEREPKVSVGIDRDAVALEHYDVPFSQLTTDQRADVNAIVEEERRKLSALRGTEVEAEKERRRKARPLPKDLQNLTGQKTVGAAEEAGFSIPDDPKQLQGFRAQRTFTSEAIRRIDRIQSILAKRPEAHGSSGAVSAAAEGLAAQVINYARLLGLGGAASRRVEDYRAVFSEIGVTNRVLQSQTLGLAFLAAAAEGLQGRELTDRKIELILRRIGGGATQSPQAYAAVLEQYKRELDFRLQAEAEGVFGQKTPSLLPPLGSGYKTPDDVGAALDRGEIAEDEAVRILKERFGYTD
jgi:hypothetical protein